MTTPSLQPLAAIASFHAHVYFDGPEQRAIALALRERIGERFAVALGRVHDGPIGPHARAMYQVAFDVETFGKIVPWLMLNRQGPDGAGAHEHAQRGADHLLHALWMGQVLEIVGPEQPGRRHGGRSEGRGRRTRRRR